VNLRTTEHLIGGRWTPATTTDQIVVRSPHDGHVLDRVALANTADIDRAVGVARSAFDQGDWPRMPASERAALVGRLAQRYGSSLEEMAQLISSENGSPISFSRLGQAGAVPLLFTGFLDAAGAMAWEEPVETMFGTQLLRRQAVGVVGAITAWNVPQILIVAKLAPALLAGCSIVVKASPDAPLDALLLAEMVHEVGFPSGVVSIVVGGAAAGRALVDHAGVDKVAFTGSSAVGREIASVCGRNLTRCSVELGGKSAAIILDDADLDRTVAGLRFASFMNNGQACAAQTRVLAPRSRYDDVVEALVASVSTFVVGDPLDDATEIGPLVNERQRDRVEEYLRIGVGEGAVVAIGGPAATRPADGPATTGCYVAPTVFAEVDNAMRVAQEEIFGPVVAVIPYDGDADAARLANQSVYGLGGSIWTADQDRAAALARRLRTGMIGVNQFGPSTDMPFGGFKASGIGREYGAHGLAEYVELTTIHGLKADRIQASSRPTP